MNHILFVCTGNTCRSPLAEGMLRQITEREGLELTVQSAGVSAYDGGPISANSFTVLKEKGFDGTITSSALAAAAVREADLILTMTQSHKRCVIQMFPDAADKTFMLKEYVEEDPRVLSLFEELGRMYAELHMKQALGQPVAEQLHRRIAELESLSPNYDISDPFGGPLHLYKETASEIEECLYRLVRKLKSC